jgi:hypothetical protein
MRTNLLGAVATGFLIWACAKANDTQLVGRGQPLPGSGGNSSGGGGLGGSSAGTSAGGKGSAGKSGAGASSTGGASAQAGTGTGGNDPSSGGSDSFAGAPGAAGEDGVPPEVLARARVVLRYQVRNTTPTDASAVEMRLFLENKVSDPLDLDNVVVRYWMTSEPAQRTLNCYYAAPVASSNVHLAYVDDGDDSHIEITFTGGEIRGPTTDLNSTEFQVKADPSNGEKFDQDDDHSFDASLSTDNPPSPNDKITVYLAGRLIWGCEPDGTCPENGEGGAGGEGGEGGQAGQAGAGGAPQGGEAGQGGAGGEGGQSADGGQPASAGQSGAPG